MENSNIIDLDINEGRFMALSLSSLYIHNYISRNGGELMANYSRVAIQETFELPSRGIIYNGEIPAEITLRAMTTLEEKMRLASIGTTNVIPNLIKACIVEPKNLDVNKLKLADLQFLIYKLRIITYGEDYKISLRCLECGNQFDVTINLDEIPVKMADETYTEPFEIGPLPVSGDMLSCRILSSGDYIEIEKEARRIRSKFPNYVGDPEFILSYLYKIEKVNGEEIPYAMLQSYVENMHARDMRYFDSKYNQKVDSVGMDLEMTRVCPICSVDVNFVLPITSEFFRPTYD